MRTLLNIINEYEIKPLSTIPSNLCEGNYNSETEETKKRRKKFEGDFYRQSNLFALEYLPIVHNSFHQKMRESIGTGKKQI